LIIVGDGAESGAIRAAIAKENAGDYISYLGRVPFEDVQRYYSAMDVLVYPRQSLRITEIVTPLKPLEAMALAKPVLGSAVGGIRELIEPDATGVLFEAGNIEDFCRQAQRLLADETLRRKLGERARTMVVGERKWETLARRYEEVYDTAIRKARQLA
jgi:glycogen(starch) synthase